jgi:hypothetical protein
MFGQTTLPWGNGFQRPLDTSLGDFLGRYAIADMATNRAILPAFPEIEYQYSGT